MRRYHSCIIGDPFPIIIRLHCRPVRLMATALGPNESLQEAPSSTTAAQSAGEYDSQKDLLQSFSELRGFIHCDKQLAERDNFLKKASNQISHCRTMLQEKWTEFLGSIKSAKKNSEEFDCENFQKISNFAECCKVINRQILKVNQQHHEEFVADADLRETERQLLEKEVLLSFYGQYNAGKSTILNAILRNRFLPVTKDPETSFRLIIQPTCKGDEFMNPMMRCSYELECEDFSRDLTQNCLLSGDSVLANGPSEVYSRLKLLNTRVRRQQEDAGNSLYVLKAKMPLFQQVPDGWQVSLVDNPGFNEHTVHVTDAAAHSLKVSSACVYVTTHEQYRGRETADFFKRMYRGNKDIFRQRRLIVVINKLDRVCNMEEDGDSVDEEGLAIQDVVDKVHKFIQEVCDCKNVPKEVVIPVFGLWAYKARMLAREPCSVGKKRFAVKILSRFSSQPSGQGENPQQILASKPGADLAKTLLEHSNILDLETRLQDVATSCIIVWTQKIQNDYAHYLLECKVKLCERKDNLKLKIEDMEARVSSKLELMKEIYTIYRKIIEAANDKSKHESPIWQVFQRHYRLDVEASDPRATGERLVTLLVTNFKEELKTKIGNEGYGPQDFIEDLRSIVKETSNNFQETINERCCFNRLLAARNNCLNRVTSDVSRMATLMEKLIPASTHYDHMVSRDSLEGAPVLQVPCFEQADRSIQAPNVYGSFFERLLVFCQNAIEALKNTLNPTFKSDDESFGDEVSGEADPANKHKEVEPVPVEQHDPGLQTQRDSESTPATPTSSTTLATEVASPATEGPVEKSTHKVTPTQLPSPDKDDNLPQQLSTSTSLSISATCKQQDSPSTTSVRSRRNSYRKWQPEMEAAVIKLRESIEKEIQSHFGDDFEEMVVHQYWMSYCELAMKKLSNFDDAYTQQLNHQTTVLTDDINQLVRESEEHKLLSYHANIVSFMRTQLLTLVGKLHNIF